MASSSQTFLTFRLGRPFPQIPPVGHFMGNKMPSVSAAMASKTVTPSQPSVMEWLGWGGEKHEKTWNVYGWDLLWVEEKSG